MQGKVSPEPNATQVYVGVDVCKERLDVYLHPVGKTVSVNNDPKRNQAAEALAETS